MNINIINNTDLRQTWSNMKQRCNNPNHRDYKYYGGRGISVCNRWSKYENFYADMGPRPDKLTLDRIDNNGDYEPDNCKWSTMTEQIANRRPSIFKSQPLKQYTINGITKSLADWAWHYKVNMNTVIGRTYQGMTVEEALTKPVRSYNRGQ